MSNFRGRFCYGFMNSLLSVLTHIFFMGMAFLIITVSAYATDNGDRHSSSVQHAKNVKPRLFVQAQLGIVSESDFGPALAFIYEPAFAVTNVFAISVGRQVGERFFRWPATMVLYGSLQHYGERGTQSDITGATVYIKAYKQFRLGKQRVPLRLGLGEGLSYVDRIPRVEVEDFLPQRSAKLVNYLEWTLQTSLGYFLGRPEGRFSATIRDVYIGYSIFHRSTVFGLFASEGGGVNYMGVGVEVVLK